MTRRDLDRGDSCGNGHGKFFGLLHGGGEVLSRGADLDATRLGGFVDHFESEDAANRHDVEEQDNGEDAGEAHVWSIEIPVLLLGDIGGKFHFGTRFPEDSVAGAFSGSPISSVVAHGCRWLVVERKVRRRRGRERRRHHKRRGRGLRSR